MSINGLNGDSYLSDILHNFAGNPLFECEFFRKGLEVAESHEVLTTREREVFALLGEGLSNRHLSRRLAITERTVKAHVTQILEKLGMHSRLEAAISANAYSWSVEFMRFFYLDGSWASESGSVVFHCHCAGSVNEDDGSSEQGTPSLTAAPSGSEPAETIRRN